MRLFYLKKGDKLILLTYLSESGVDFIEAHLPRRKIIFNDFGWIKINKIAPNVIIDIMTPSDVTFHDVEAGKIDMAINRFDELPQSFHQKTVWRDCFSCLLSADNPVVSKFNLNIFIYYRIILGTFILLFL